MRFNHQPYNIYNQPGSLCWLCIKALKGGCTFIDKNKPVEGWQAEENGDGYMVYSCPKFERG